MVGTLRPGPAAELGLAAGVPVVIGAGDRACEVLGAGGRGRPAHGLLGDDGQRLGPGGRIPGHRPRRAAGHGRGQRGLAAGRRTVGRRLAARPGWSGLTGIDVDELMAAAGRAPAGAGGVLALPWFGGARAPWWRPGARGGFLGLSFDHDAGDLARAVVEAVAWEVRRCLEAAGARGRPPAWPSPGPGPRGPVGRGRDGRHRPPGRRRRSGQAASAGAALLTAGGASGPASTWTELDPVVETVAPDPSAVAGYAELAGPGPSGRPGRGRPRPARRPRDPWRPVKEVRLAYGRQGLLARVPDEAVVLTPTELPGLADEDGAVRAALRAPTVGPPLAELVGRGDRVAVVFPDLTRPMPNRTVLPPLLDELARLGAGPDRVQLLCATGTHRQATAAEMAELVGPTSWPATPSTTTAATTATTSRWAWSTGSRSASIPATWRPTSGSSPVSSSPTSSPVSAAGPRGCARGWPPPRPSWRPTARPGSPTAGPPGW